MMPYRCLSVLFPLRYAQKQYRREHADGMKEKPYIFTPHSPPPTIEVSSSSSDGGDKGGAAAAASVSCTAESLTVA